MSAEAPAAPADGAAHEQTAPATPRADCAAQGPAEPATAGVRSLQEDLESQALSDVREQRVLAKFRRTAEHVARHAGIRGDWSVRHIAELAGIEIEAIHRESALGLALWVAWLQVTAQFMPRSDLKYQSVADFLAVYVCFVGYDDARREHLMHVANWMAYLLSKIPARKNKGFALQVVPKLLEGWQARYITGSGQSRATEDRVKIYEVEGDVLPIQRLQPSKRGRLTKRGRKSRQGGKRRREDSDLSEPSATGRHRGEFGWSVSRTSAYAPVPAPGPAPALAPSALPRRRPRVSRTSPSSSFSISSSSSSHAAAPRRSAFPSTLRPTPDSSWDPALSPFVSPCLAASTADPSAARRLRFTVESALSGPRVQLLVTDTPAVDNDDCNDCYDGDGNEYCIASGAGNLSFPPLLPPTPPEQQQWKPAGSPSDQLGSDSGTSTESSDLAHEPAFASAIDRDLFGSDCWGLRLDEFSGLMDDFSDIEADLFAA